MHGKYTHDKNLKKVSSFPSFIGRESGHTEHTHETVDILELIFSTLV